MQQSGKMEPTMEIYLETQEDQQGRRLGVLQSKMQKKIKTCNEQSWTRLQKERQNYEALLRLDRE